MKIFGFMVIPTVREGWCSAAYSFGLTEAQQKRGMPSAYAYERTHFLIRLDLFLSRP
jgi:hypothetical protein